MPKKKERPLLPDLSRDAQASAWKEKSIPLQDVVLSNSWALQAILNYLEEIHPGARDRIWHHYEMMKQQADAFKETRLPEEEEKDEVTEEDEE
ncbi:MAG TPA: hypothetical protein PK360_02125 [bacterium]|nr:hypothetical protein [bacterium]